MSTKQVIDDFWLRIDPESSRGWARRHTSIEELKKECKDLIPELKRHCDVGYVSLEYDSHYECTFCSSQLADATDYGCCDESQEEHDKKEKENELPADKR